MPYDPTALKLFRNTGLTNENSIAVTDGKSVTSKQVYSGKFSKFSRTDAQRAENNAMRTKLLEALGKAFCLDGMTYSDGKVSFSKEFMDKLEALLGKDVFKRSDFGIPSKGGAVSSGKPLTQRRISAIMKQVALKARGAFELSDYKIRVDKALTEATKTGDEHLIEVFEKAKKMIRFLEKAGTNFICTHPDWIDADDDARDNIPRFFMVFEGHYKEIDSLKPMYDLVGKHVGGVFHTEYAGVTDEETKGEVIAKYLREVMQNYVQLACDIWEDSKQVKGARQQFAELAKHPGACWEAKVSKMQNFYIEKIPTKSDLSVAADHSADMSVEKCVGKEIEAYLNARKLSGKPVEGELTWQDCAMAIKRNLVGVLRPKVEVSGNDDTGYTFTPVTDDKGNRVVAPITGEELDVIGPATLYRIYNG